PAPPANPAAGEPAPGLGPGAGGQHLAGRLRHEGGRLPLEPATLRLLLRRCSADHQPLPPELPLPLIPLPLADEPEVAAADAPSGLPLDPTANHVPPNS